VWDRLRGKHAPPNVVAVAERRSSGREERMQNMASYGMRGRSREETEERERGVIMAPNLRILDDRGAQLL
jgi:hypothetical protein